jgi:hypothetical protein
MNTIKKPVLTGFLIIEKLDLDFCDEICIQDRTAGLETSTLKCFCFHQASTILIRLIVTFKMEVIAWIELNSKYQFINLLPFLVF